MPRKPRRRPGWEIGRFGGSTLEHQDQAGGAIRQAAGVRIHPGLEGTSPALLVDFSSESVDVGIL